MLKAAAIILLLLFAALMWFAFIRPVPEETATGRITGRWHKPEGETTVTPSGANRGFRAPIRIPIAEAYIFEIELDGGDTIGASLNVILGRDFEAGQRVRIRYIRRGIPPFWTRRMVTSMESAEAG